MLKMLETLPEDCVYANVDSPVGVLSLLASSKGLHAILWENDRNKCSRVLAKLRGSPRHPIIARTKKQLAEYFAGNRTRFDVPIVLSGTPFQVRAWRELTRIPYGKTISYEEQARRVGDPNKARAVGTANSKNPISIVVPCHRVIAKSGALAGFGGGLENKRLLLDLEARA